MNSTPFQTQKTKYTEGNGFSRPLISIVGAGLAGSECALQLARRGYPIKIYEMRGKKNTPAHKTNYAAELVCSNSFGNNREGTAPHQLKWEAEQLHSIILETAKKNSVPAGQALAMDREKFAVDITEMIKQNPLIEMCNTEIVSVHDIPRPAVIATGPLTSDDLSLQLKDFFGSRFLYFFDAIAPIIDADSINYEKVWFADRYDKGPPDYLNCPLDQKEYEQFIKELVGSIKVEPKEFEKITFFEGCMPIEVMAERGPETLRFGPMKPVGLKDPKTLRRPYAVVQLRKENREGSAYNMVGFQTRMTYPEQKRVFKMIPGLEGAEFFKLGSIHKNLFINSPQVLSSDFSALKDSGLYFAGQITGVEGYFESSVIGLLVAQFIDQKHSGKIFHPPPRETAMGSLMEAVLRPHQPDAFQPTNMNFSLFPTHEVPCEVPFPKGKKKEQIKSDKKNAQIDQAKEAFKNWILSP